MDKLKAISAKDTTTPLAAQKSSLSKLGLKFQANVKKVKASVNMLQKI